MRKTKDDILEEKLDVMIALQQHLLAVELFRSGVPKGAIGKHIHVATAKVVKMLGGVKKEH